MTVAFTGKDGVATYRAIVTKSAIGLHKKCGMIPTRGMTITKLFKVATEITGTKYKRGQHDLAMADLTKWIEANGTTGKGGS